MIHPNITQLKLIQCFTNNEEFRNYLIVCVGERQLIFIGNFYGLEDYPSWQIILQTPIAKSAANQIFNSRLYEILNIRTYLYFGCFILHLISGFFVIQPIIILDKIRHGFAAILMCKHLQPKDRTLAGPSSWKSSLRG